MWLGYEGWKRHLILSLYMLIVICHMGSPGESASREGMERERERERDCVNDKHETLK